MDIRYQFSVCESRCFASCRRARSGAVLAAITHNVLPPALASRSGASLYPNANLNSGACFPSRPSIAIISWISFIRDSSGHRDDGRNTANCCRPFGQCPTLYQRRVDSSPNEKVLGAFDRTRLREAQWLAASTYNHSLQPARIRPLKPCDSGIFLFPSYKRLAESCPEMSLKEYSFHQL